MTTPSTPLDPSNPTVLCFGDSLTTGYTKNGRKFHPYSSNLQTKLSEDLGVPCNCVSNGGNGETASNFASSSHLSNPSNVDVCRRKYAGLRHCLEEHRPSLVIIMAGTNDLAEAPDTLWNNKIQTPEKEANAILQSLATLHKVCHDAGISTVACSVPPSRASTSTSEDWAANSSLKDYCMVWNLLNEKIRAFCEERRKASSSSALSSLVDYFDVAEHVAYFPESSYWGHDGLHMSAKGYDRLGERLAPMVADILGRTKKEEEEKEEEEEKKKKEEEEKEKEKEEKKEKDDAQIFSLDSNRPSLPSTAALVAMSGAERAAAWKSMEYATPTLQTVAATPLSFKIDGTIICTTGETKETTTMTATLEDRGGGGGGEGEGEGGMIVINTATSLASRLNQRADLLRRILSFHETKNPKHYINLRSSSKIFHRALPPPPLWTSFPHSNHAMLQSLVDRLEELRGNEESSGNVPSVLFIEEGRYTCSGNLKIMGKPIKIYGQGIGETILDGFGLEIRGSKSNGSVVIEDLSIQGGKVNGLLAFHGMDLIVRRCKVEKFHRHGVAAYNAHISCDDVQVVGCGHSGVVVCSGGTVKLSGENTRIEGNVTSGKSCHYGLHANDTASKIQIVTPLRKDTISINNGGGGNWNFYGTIQQVSA